MPEELSSSEKAALTLMSLGKQQAAEVMKFLTEQEVKKLSRTFLQVQEVKREKQQDVALEFHRMLRAAEKMVVDGREFAKDVIESAFGEEESEGMLSYISGQKKEPLNTLLNEIPQTMVEAFMSSEHPQTVAFLLCKMKPERAAELLAELPEEAQTEVMVRIAQLELVKGDVIDEVREVLRNQIRGSEMGAEEELGGPKAAADILNFVDRNAEERILGDLEESVPELAEDLRNLMFTFEDVAKIDERGIQALLKEIPREDLVIALKTASDSLKELLFGNVSQRAADMLREDLETLGPTKLKDVVKAQQGIVDTVRRLEAEGKLVIAGGGGDDVLV